MNLTTESKLHANFSDRLNLEYIDSKTIVIEATHIYMAYTGK